MFEIRIEICIYNVNVLWAKALSGLASALICSCSDTSGLYYEIRMDCIWNQTIPGLLIIMARAYRFMEILQSIFEIMYMYMTYKTYMFLKAHRTNVDRRLILSADEGSNRINS